MATKRAFTSGKSKSVPTDKRRWKLGQERHADVEYLTLTLTNGAGKSLGMAMNADEAEQFATHVMSAAKRMRKGE
jgi:hypothetical protein